MESRFAVLELESVEDRVGLDPLDIQIEVDAHEEPEQLDIDDYFEFEERKSPPPFSQDASRPFRLHSPPRPFSVSSQGHLSRQVQRAPTPERLAPRALRRPDLRSEFHATDFFD